MISADIGMNPGDLFFFSWTIVKIHDWLIDTDNHGARVHLSAQLIIIIIIVIIIIIINEYYYSAVKSKNFKSTEQQKKINQRQCHAG